MEVAGVDHLPAVQVAVYGEFVRWRWSPAGGSSPEWSSVGSEIEHILSQSTRVFSQFVILIDNLHFVEW